MMIALALQVVVAADASQPHLAIDADGVLLAVFLRNGNVEFSASADQGKTFSAPVVAIDAKGRAKGGMQRGPRVAVDGQKTIYVTAPLAFDDAEFQKRYPTQDLYLATSVDGGKTFGKPVMVNDVPKKAPESLHWLAAGVDGAYVAWLDLRAREKGQDLFLAKISEKGKKVSRNTLVATSLCECCAPALAVDPKGNPVLAYRDGAGKSSRPIFLVAASKTVRLNTKESKVDG
ncbi:MAG TPA: sialidase family protein [Planctomycetota bacterium]